MKRKLYPLITFGFMLAMFISSVALNAQELGTASQSERTAVVCDLSMNVTHTNVTCNGLADGTITVNAAGTGNIVITINGETYNPNASYAPGNYTVYVIMDNDPNCTATETLNITQPDLVTLTASATNVSCNGLDDGTITASATGGATITVNGNPYVEGTLYSPGQYTLAASAPNGNADGVCTDTKILNIGEPPLLRCEITSSQNASCSDCADGSATVVVIGGTPDYDYLWSDNQTTATASNLLPGEYDVTITDANGCTSICYITIGYDEQEGCTYTQGYWKTHSSYGPAPYDLTWALIGEDTPFYYSGQTYYEVMWTPVSGNPYYILAHQFIAAHLNFLNGADPSVAQAEFDIAEALLNNPANTPDEIKKLKKEAKKVWTDPAGILDDYNNGDIGPGHCDDEGDRSADELNGIINTEENVSISAYPNPFMNTVIIEFTMEEDTDVTLEVYNMTGAKVASLYKGDVQANQTYSFDFDGIAHINQGTFIYVLRAGKTVKMGRLVMMK